MKKIALIVFTANSSKVSFMLHGRREFNEASVLCELIGENPLICEESLYKELLQKNLVPSVKKVIFSEDPLCDPDDDAIVCRSIWKALDVVDKPEEKGDTIFFFCTEVSSGKILDTFKFQDVYTIHKISADTKTHKCVF